jgi:hypothetical protein
MREPVEIQNDPFADAITVQYNNIVKAILLIAKGQEHTTGLVLTLLNNNPSALNGLHQNETYRDILLKLIEQGLLQINPNNSQQAVTGSLTQAARQVINDIVDINQQGFTIKDGTYLVKKTITSGPTTEPNISDWEIVFMEKQQKQATTY